MCLIVSKFQGHFRSTCMGKRKTERVWGTENEHKEWKDQQTNENSTNLKNKMYKTSGHTMKYEADM